MLRSLPASLSLLDSLPPRRSPRRLRIDRRRRPRRADPEDFTHTLPGTPTVIILDGV